MLKDKSDLHRIVNSARECYYFDIIEMSGKKAWCRLTQHCPNFLLTVSEMNV